MGPEDCLYSSTPKQRADLTRFWPADPLSSSTPRRFQLQVKNCPESWLVVIFFVLLCFSVRAAITDTVSQPPNAGSHRNAVMNTAAYSPLRAVLSFPFRHWLHEAPSQGALGKALPEGLRAAARTSRAKVNVLINTRHWVTLRIIQGNLQNVGGRERGRIKLGEANWLALMFEESRWGRRKRSPAPRINRGLGLPKGGRSNLIKIKPAGICSNWCKTCGQHKIIVRGKEKKKKIGRIF